MHDKPTTFVDDGITSKGGASSGRGFTAPATPPKPNYFVSALNGCWIWQGAKSATGYGNMRYGGQSIAAHRAFHAFYNAPLEPGQVVMHSCDEPRCVNPEHLSAGTQADNMADGAAKGRINRGEANPRGRLTEAQALCILKSARAGVPRPLIAKAFGITNVHVGDILHGNKWAHLQGDNHAA